MMLQLLVYAVHAGGDGAYAGRSCRLAEPTCLGAVHLTLTSEH